MRPLRGRETGAQEPIPHDAAEMAGGHADGPYHTGQPTRGDTGESEDGGGEGEGERGWGSGSLLACVVVAYGLVGAALTDAPTPLHCNRQSHREHRYGDMHERSHRYRYRDMETCTNAVIRYRGRYRYRDAWRERDKYAAREGSEPEHGWYSSNTAYLTQRLSWRVQGSGGGV